MSKAARLRAIREVMESDESQAIRKVLAARAKRVQECLAEIEQVLARHQCAFQVQVIDRFGPGEQAQRGATVTVAPLEAVTSANGKP